MARGLFWLSLLVVFFILAWSGWNEYQKLEAYRQWAENFDQAKYDIYAIIGVKGKEITWGKPSRSIPNTLPKFLLTDVDKIELLVNDKSVDLGNLPNKGKPIIQFNFINKDQSSIKIPFTEIDLAAKWVKYLDNLTKV
ncbi:hypothetical protein [Crocosphaera chwakensis]|uniref:Uncharacterized protein n=1 Tax=Crocosphaera chwakensis CCY0110 TaxID=391612 RepID=A3INT5_9CHRO|nr:hypothetical protein [Crocosphaera chwakensis]EAZ91983.1 hypothetical protein CY0110_29949 [Crocosphaera chwakensis CCY0110]